MALCNMLLWLCLVRGRHGGGGWGCGKQPGVDLIWCLIWCVLLSPVMPGQARGRRGWGRGRRGRSLGCCLGLPL